MDISRLTENVNVWLSFQVQDHLTGWRTLSHGAPITAVDWHPTLPIFLTGSADNSVRVTSLLS